MSRVDLSIKADLARIFQLFTPWAVAIFRLCALSQIGKKYSQIAVAHFRSV